MVTVSSKIKDIFLPREHVYQLLQKGLDKNLITVIAGPGYGKTFTVASFLAGRSERVSWLNLSHHDNLSLHFWHSFSTALSEHFPELAKTFMQLGFPNTSSKLDNILRLLTKEFYAGEPFILVVDDYHNIENKDIKLFLEYFIEMSPENFCLILLSNANTQLQIGHDNYLHIGVDDLKFNPEETSAFLALYQIQVSPDIFEHIIEDMEGWPLALTLYAEHFYCETAVQYNKNHKISQLDDFFEREYFISFSEQTKQILIQLSHFQYFPGEIVSAFKDIHLFDTITQNIFISYDSKTSFFKFQKLYHNFLQAKQPTLTDSQVKEIYSLAGDCFGKKGLYLLAIDCYFKSQNYDKCIEALFNVPRGRKDKATCDSLLWYLEQLPEQVSKDNTLVIDYMKAFLLLNNLEVAKAKALFEKIRMSMETEELSAEQKCFLGEIYLALADICLMSSDSLFADYYQKADELLPSGSIMRLKSVALLGNNDAFFLINNAPGELEALLEKLFATAPYPDRVANGSGHGFELLYAAEASYLTYNLEKAKEYCCKAVYKAFSREQHDIICNSYLMLAKIAIAEGDYDTAQKQVHKIVGYININELADLFDMRDCVQSWFHILTGNLDKVSNWVTSSSKYYCRAPIDTGRNLFVYAIHLYARNKYAEANAFLEETEKLFLQKSLWSLQVSFYIFRSVFLLKLGEEEKALQYFHKAYQMTYHNDIIMPYIEFGSVVYPILDLAMKSKAYSFNTAWLENILHKTETFEVNFMKFVYECNKENRVEAIPENKLTKEELEILKQLAQGISREQIEGVFGCDTRKKFIGIFKKLGAINRMEAIRIAKSRKYI